jgi:hypothetical protein
MQMPQLQLQTCKAAAASQYTPQLELRPRLDLNQITCTGTTLLQKPTLRTNKP